MREGALTPAREFLERALWYSVAFTPGMQAHSQLGGDMGLQDLPATLSIADAAELLGWDVTWPTRQLVAVSCRRCG